MKSCCLPLSTPGSLRSARLWPRLALLLVLLALVLVVLPGRVAASERGEVLIPIHVAAGTNLIHLARDYCHTPGDWRRIAAINKLAEPYLIIRDTTLQVPLSLLIVEQNTRVALEIADYGYVMESGRIVLEGQAQELRDNEDVREFYLGLDREGVRKSFREVKHYKRRKRWLG